MLTPGIIFVIGGYLLFEGDEETTGSILKSIKSVLNLTKHIAKNAFHLQ